MQILGSVLVSCSRCSAAAGHAGAERVAFIFRATGSEGEVDAERGRHLAKNLFCHLHDMSSRLLKMSQLTETCCYPDCT